MSLSHKNTRYPHCFFSAVLIVLLLMATFRIGVSSGMRETISYPFRWYVTSMCGAISSLKYGRGGYVCFESVFDKLRNIEYEDPKAFNQTIQQALALQNPSGDTIYTMEETDAGYIDYCRLAFILFGYRVESLFYMYVLLFLTSILIFFVTFRKNKMAIFMLIIFLLAHYVVVKAAPEIGPNLGTVHSYRFISILAILPLIHLLMLTLFRQSLKIPVFVGASLQSFIFTFALWMRGSLLWMVVLLLAYTAREALKGQFNCGIFIKNVKMKLWPVLLVLSTVLILKISIPFILDPVYGKNKGAGHHVVWHSVYAGLALHPAIRENYSKAIYDGTTYGVMRGDRVHGPVCSKEHMQGHPLKVAVKEWLCRDAQRWIFEIIYAVKHPIEYRPNDQDSYSAAFKWLRDRGISEDYLFNFRPEEAVDYKKSFAWFGFKSETNKKREFMWEKDFRWSPYESILAKVTRNIVLNHPLHVIQNIFIDKSIRYICACSHYASLSYLPLTFLLIALFHFIFEEHERSEVFQVLKLLAGVFIFSLIPVFLIYADSYSIADSVLILVMLIFIVLFVFIKNKTNFLKTKLVLRKSSL